MIKRPLKISNEFYEFVKKGCTNRVKVDTDEHEMKLCDFPDTIVNYFKLNNDRYLELIKMENKNGAN